MIRRRHVFYISGYDPQGVPGYYRLFKRELARFASLWSVHTTLSAPKESTDDPLGARWHVTTAGPNWQNETTYDFWRWDDIIARDLSRPMWKRAPLLARVFFENLFDGTLRRVFRANWRFGVFYLTPYIFVAVNLLAPLVLARFAVRLLDFLNFPGPVLVIAGLLVLVATYAVIRRFGERWSILAMADAWIWFRDWGRGLRPDYEQRIDAFARRLIAETRASTADELVLVGHSGGGTTAIPVLARALELEPHFAKGRPPLTVLALGTSLPLAAAHRPAKAVRDALRRAATEPSVLWVEYQARKDICNFQNFDLIAGLGIDLDGPRHNPMLRAVRFRDALAPETYKRLRLNIFRMHFQFIMGNDRRAPYDYFMMVCGPASVRGWAEDGLATLASFGSEGTYAPLGSGVLEPTGH